VPQMTPKLMDDSSPPSSDTHNRIILIRQSILEVTVKAIQ
jgi:hypothetical protein